MSTLFANDSVLTSFFIREQRKVLLAGVSRQATLPADLVAAVVADVAQLGFTFDGEVVARLRGLDVDALGQFHRHVVDVLQKTVGAHVRYRPLFKNFPHDVPESSGYFIRRLVGYLESVIGPLGTDYTVLSCGHVVNHRLFDLNAFGACPVCQHQVAELEGGEYAAVLPLEQLTPLKVLRLAGEDELWSTFGNLVASRTSLSDSSKEFLSTVMRLDAKQAVRRLPVEVPFKENAAFVTAALVRQGVAAEDLARLIKTPTDVLRVAVALCGGDVSLKEVTRFKLNNGQRHFLMAALNALKQEDKHATAEMLGYRGRWLRLGEVLHVGHYQRRYAKAWALFDVMRNKEASVQTHASRVEALLSHSDLTDGSVRAQLLSALSQRPGELARKLDTLLQRQLPMREVLSTFKEVLPSVSTTILLTLLAHFRNRAKPAEFRAFMPKGSMAKMFVQEGDARLPLDLQSRLTVLDMVEAELKRRFAEREPLGKVYVDSSLEGALVPFSQRSASSGMSPLTRGSCIALDSSKDFVRLFIHWKESTDSGTIDVDLTCGLYDESWKKMDHLSWTNTRSMGRSAHSGDVRSASGKHGACEFIDLDLPALKRAGVRYAAVTVFSWTGQKFSTFPCFAGFMEREDAGTGKQFEPQTVSYKFDVNGEHVIMVPMVLDVESGQVIWADLSLKGRGGYNSIESVGGRTVSQFKAVLAMQDQRVSMKELFELHGQARGSLVEAREDADVVLGADMLNRLDEVVAKWL